MSGSPGAVEAIVQAAGPKLAALASSRAVLRTSRAPALKTSSVASSVGMFRLCRPDVEPLAANCSEASPQRAFQVLVHVEVLKDSIKSDVLREHGMPA